MPAQRGHPTIIDVAQRAGVSKSLVSLVMRGANSVSDQKRNAVLEAAKELGYRPNAAARSLARNRTHLLGVMVSDFHNPFFAEVLDGVEDAATATGYGALFNTGNRLPDREIDAVKTLLELRTEGIILAGPTIDPRVVSQLAPGTPMVVVGSTVDVSGVDCVASDNHRGSQMAVEHLVSLGHTDIAHIDGGNGAGAADRRAGYVAAMKSHGLQPRVVDGSFTEEGGAKGVVRLSDSDLPTAIYAANDIAAVAAVHALEDLGHAVPQDVSVVGYDNVAFTSLGHVGLTTINQPRRVMGALAVELLIERIERTRHRRKRVALEPSLVVRGTTAPPR